MSVTLASPSAVLPGRRRIPKSHASSVDHDERRRRIARVVVDIISREGLQAATIRRIAAQVGFSTTVVTHYFAEKQELLRWTYQALAEEGRARVEQALAHDPTDLVSALVAMCAVDEPSIRLWRVFVAFCDEAARDPVFAGAQRAQTDLALRRIGDILRARYGERDDIDEVSRLLNALVQGVSVQLVVDPGRWSPAQIRIMLDTQVRMLLGELPTA